MLTGWQSGGEPGFGKYPGRGGRAVHVQCASAHMLIRRTAVVGSLPSRHISDEHLLHPPSTGGAGGGAATGERGQACGERPVPALHAFSCCFPSTCMSAAEAVKRLAGLQRGRRLIRPLSSQRFTRPAAVRSLPQPLPASPSLPEPSTPPLPSSSLCAPGLHHPQLWRALPVLR